jgi:hypothetical protein
MFLWIEEGSELRQFYGIRLEAQNTAVTPAEVSHRGGPGSRPGQSMWNLWWTKWHWDRFFSEFFGFPQSIYLSTVALQTNTIGECVIC